jgi:hypothetical protein
MERYGSYIDLSVFGSAKKYFWTQVEINSRTAALYLFIEVMIVLFFYENSFFMKKSYGNHKKYNTLLFSLEFCIKKVLQT